MSDCNHERIKCMVCHRDVGIHEQHIPDNIAVARIQELELQVKELEGRLRLFTNKSKIGIPKGWPKGSLQGYQHEAT
jgi:hypothetical protein